MLRLHTHQVFGQFLNSSNRVAQLAGESIPVSTVSRVAAAADNGGRFSFHAIPTGGATATLTIWYSNIPNPSESVDGDWVQDTAIGTVNLVSGTPIFTSIGNITTDWIRYKVNVTVGTLQLSLWHRADRSY